LKNSNQKFSKFYSKEYSNTDYRPSLVITFPDIDVDEQVVAGNIEFLRNYPNPFNPETTIQFSLSEQSEVEIVIFNSKGEKIKNTVSGNYPAGTHYVLWNGKDERNNPVASGIYFYQIKSENSVKMNKMILMK
jgi:flagellar hook assembly protein FlgD